MEGTNSISDGCSPFGPSLAVKERAELSETSPVVGGGGGLGGGVGTHKVRLPGIMDPKEEITTTEEVAGDCMGRHMTPLVWSPCSAALNAVDRLADELLCT